MNELLGVMTIIVTCVYVVAMFLHMCPRNPLRGTDHINFKKGHLYKTLAGKVVLITEDPNEMKHYETVLGDDGIHRYNRSTQCHDNGRTTGSDWDDTSLEPLGGLCATYY